MGAKVLRYLQLGKETTSGTAVAATTRLRWEPGAVIQDMREITEVEEAIGQRFGKGRTYQAKLLAQLDVGDQPATFEELPYWLQAGVEGLASASQDGTEGSTYIYQYDAGNTAAITPTTYTIEASTGQEAYEMEYGFVSEFSLAGAAGEALTVSGTWFGRQVSDTTMTAAQTVQDVDEILFGKGKLYIDAAGGTIGDTQKTDTWLGFNLTVPTGLVPNFTADGNTYFTSAKWAPEDAPTLELTTRYDATGAALMDAAKAGSVKLVRMTFEGPDAGTAGDSYSCKTLNIDMAVVPTEVPSAEDDGGDDTLTFNFSVVDSDSTQLQFIVVNELSALA